MRIHLMDEEFPRTPCCDGTLHVVAAQVMGCSTRPAIGSNDDYIDLGGFRSSCVEGVTEF